jgi:cytidylate kinase
MLIAIDGPAASGKGTIARRLAIHFSLPYLDTGILYRAVAHHLTEKKLSLNDAQAAQKVAEDLCLEGSSIKGQQSLLLRGRTIGEAASIIASYPEVRAALLSKQRFFASHPGGAILDGRDIGTVVCPHANLKFFITASLEERARRRTLELITRGEVTTYDVILEDLRCRDTRDFNRKTAPLQCAPDAFIIDTSFLTEEAAFACAREHVETFLPVFPSKFLSLPS